MAREDQIYTKFYESARAEIIQRLALRDHALIAYVAVIGGYLAFIIQKYGFQYNSETACESVALNFPLPIICLLFTLVIISHHLVVNDLGAYLRFEWIDNLPQGKNLIHWDNSTSLRTRGKFIQTVRTLAQCLALCVPFFFEGFIYSNNFLVLSLHCAWLTIIHLVLSACSAGLIIWIHLYAHRARVAQLHLLDQQAQPG